MNDLEKRVQALEKALSAFGKDLDSQTKRLGEELPKAAKRKTSTANEPSCSYAEHLHNQELFQKATSEEKVNLIERSVRAIRYSNLSNLSQDIAIGVIVAKILLHDEDQQKRLISQK